MKIIYLHGLGSNGQSSTARGLSELGFDVISPDYRPQFYNESLEQLVQLVEHHQPVLIAGTSMGGYYALKLYERFVIPTIAINPCFEPATLLQKYLDQPAHDYVTDTPIPFVQAMLDAFLPTASAHGRQPDTLQIVIGMNDDVIPAAQQQQFCIEQGWNWNEVDWGHRVDDVELLGEMINRFKSQ
ncbi:YqiA/YcfP family alpha/beta fold hydrolase [Pontibacterium granulatum]|uniref:YqiA/YcfP family alpha/beta fold hydrolase n=1 Tax=Pontibacterium granulatum TaxID=2036029 RepID=UPI00249C86FD|nr:YqiA/YcfP family alpha/beta fold hydrolase [Pontibacterium granulatum]MDI3324377.1 YqiA/YcfP family alpha/beta fold hydrolase [Pontibacterium granulatum]